MLPRSGETMPSKKLQEAVFELGGHTAMMLYTLSCQENSDCHDEAECRQQLSAIRTG